MKDKNIDVKNLRVSGRLVSREQLSNPRVGQCHGCLLEAAKSIDLRDNHVVVHLGGRGHGKIRVDPVDRTKLWKCEEHSGGVERDFVEVLSGRRVRCGSLSMAWVLLFTECHAADSGVYLLESDVIEVPDAGVTLERAIEVGRENWKGIDGVSYIRELRGSDDED